MATTLVSFFTEAVKNEFKSREEGRPIYDDLLHVRKVVAGSRDETVNLATQEDKDAYPDEFKRFQDREAGPAKTGTPIEELPGTPTSFVKEMSHYQVRTVEELAELHDSQIAQMGPGVREKVDLAKAWLDRAKGGKSQSQVSGRVKDLKDENDGLKRQLADLDRLKDENVTLKARLADAERQIETLTAPPSEPHDRDQSRAPKPGA